MIDFFIENKNEVFLILFGYVLGLVGSCIPKLFKKSTREHFGRIVKRVKMKINGRYTFRELKNIENMPPEKRSKRQQKALDNAKAEIRSSLEKHDIKGVHKS